MKLKTSYFNEAILHKNITRFAPLWGIYLVLFGLAVLFADSVVSGYRPSASEWAESVGYTIPAMATINFGYAALSALLLFGDLHKTRMCYSLHAMPMRREGWFLTNVVSGLSFSLVPNLIIMVILLFKCGTYFYAPLAWLLGSTLSFLCFFGIATFCMHITGKSAAAAGMYFLINYFSLLLYSLTELYFVQFWPGVIVPETQFETFVPLTQLSNMGLEFYHVYMIAFLPTPEWIGFDTGFLWAGVGILLLVLALLVYRKRDLESAGDFISLRPAAPVVLVIYTVSIGGVLWAMFNFNFFILFVGLAIGFFTGKMMLQRTVKVFHKKTFLGYGIVTACVLLSIGIAKLDPMGITRWVPEANRIESVMAGTSQYSYSYNNAGFDDPEDIELVRQIHSYAVNNLDATDRTSLTDIYTDFYDRDREVSVYICYTMTDGSTKERSYEIPVDSEGGKLVRKLYSQPEFLFDGYASDAEELLTALTQVEVMRYDREEKEQQFLNQKQWEGLVRALEQDWLSDALVQVWPFHEDDDSLCELQLILETEDGNRYISLTIYEDCTNTVTWLKANGYLD